jgi:integrase/recombinase XerD
MKNQNTFSISFFLKKDKAKGGNAPLFARITINGEFKDLSTKRLVKISAWNQKEQKLTGKNEEDTLTKEKIRILRNQINTAYDELRHE